MTINTYKYCNNFYLILRDKPEDNKGLPKIPAQPIGYSDARKLLEKMGGKDSPVTWKGGMEGIAYKVKNIVILQN